LRRVEAADAKDDEIPDELSAPRDLIDALPRIPPPFWTAASAHPTAKRTARITRRIQRTIVPCLLLFLPSFFFVFDESILPIFFLLLALAAAVGGARSRSRAKMKEQACRAKNLPAYLHTHETVFFAQPRAIARQAGYKPADRIVSKFLNLGP